MGGFWQKDGDVAEGGAGQQPGGNGSAARDVFVSYASQDTAIAERVYGSLERNGVSCWMAPRDVVPGAPYSSEIVHAIDSSKAMVLILSQHAAASPHVLREVERATSRRHAVIALRLDQAPLPAELEYFLNACQWLDASGGALNTHLSRLAAAVQVALKQSTGTEAAAPPRTVAPYPKPGRQRQIMVALAAIIALSAAWFAVNRLWQSPRPAVAAGMPEKSVSSRSVAVLPFVDMSEKKDQEYFSDGLSEELIDHLAHAENLKVIARTSSFQFKGKNEDMRTIGQRLGVANLLEGSVRTSGNAIRVTAQLINVADGTHLWSETYDRKAGDIFKIQDEIVAAVVSALRARITALPASADPSAPNIESHKKVLLARYFNYRNTQPDSDRALGAIDEAIKIDPENGRAWVELADIYFVRAVHGWMPSRDAYLAARRAVDRALAISPNLASAHRALGSIEKVFNNNDEVYRRERQRSLELDPSLFDSLDQGIDAYQEGRVHEAAQLLKHAADLNPLDTWTLSWYGNGLYADNDLKGAEQVMRGILDIQPDIAGTRCPLGEMLLADHQPDAALEVMSKEPDEAERLTCMPAALWALGRQSEADAMLAQVKDKYKDSAAYGLAYCYAARGNKDEAFKWLNRAYDNRDLHLQFLNEDPDLRSLHSDPRFAALEQKLKDRH